MHVLSSRIISIPANDAIHTMHHASKTFWITNSIFWFIKHFIHILSSFIISLLQHKLFEIWEWAEWVMGKECSKVALKMHSKHSRERPVHVFRLKSFKQSFMIRFIFYHLLPAFPLRRSSGNSFLFSIHSYSFVLCISVCALIVSNSVDIIFSTSYQSAQNLELNRRMDVWERLKIVRGI